MTLPKITMSAMLQDILVAPNLQKSRPGSVSQASISYCISELTSYCAVSVFAAVDQGLSDRIAKAIGAPTVKPLQVKPASEAIRFRANIGLSSQQNKL